MSQFLCFRDDDCRSSETATFKTEPGVHVVTSHSSKQELASNASSERVTPDHCSKTSPSNILKETLGGMLSVEHITKQLWRLSPTRLLSEKTGKMSDSKRSTVAEVKNSDISSFQNISGKVEAPSSRGKVANFDRVDNGENKCKGQYTVPEIGNIQGYENPGLTLEKPSADSVAMETDAVEGFLNLHYAKNCDNTSPVVCKANTSNNEFLLSSRTCDHNMNIEFTSTWSNQRDSLPETVAQESFQEMEKLQECGVKMKASVLPVRDDSPKVSLWPLLTAIIYG